MNFQHISRVVRTAIALCFLVSAGFIVSCEECPDKQQGTVKTVSQDSSPMPPDHIRFKENGRAFESPRFQVAGGNLEDAKNYYQTVLSPHLQFLTPETITNSTIKDLLEYFGYSDITAKDLHRLPSSELMKLHEPGDILATCFFAPKITQVEREAPQIPQSGFGWRKLIRFKARTASKAAENGIGALFFLQNIFEATIDGNPFDADKNFSKFNQAIVVRNKLVDLKNAAYFLAYGPLVKNDGERPIKFGNDFQDEGKIGFGLGATFDGRVPLTDPDPETGVAAKDYFVPVACVECHGRDGRRGKVNFLDTDHWFDRVTPDYGLSDEKYKLEDFTALAASPKNGVLYDGGQEVSKPEFQVAFGVIHSLNEEISNQNALFGETRNFQLAAVTKWLAIHPPGPAGTVHVPPYKRGLGTPTWEPDNESHRKLLYYFNRYCYRCHSSVLYNVFDLQGVNRFRGLMSGKLLDISDPTNWMPQDRPFPGLVNDRGDGAATGNLKEFLELLSALR
jgi:hypothetical protein